MLFKLFFNSNFTWLCKGNSFNAQMHFTIEVKLWRYTKGGRMFFLTIYLTGCKQNVVQVIFFLAMAKFVKLTHVKPHEVSIFLTKLFSGYKFPCAKKKTITHMGIVANSDIHVYGFILISDFFFQYQSFAFAIQTQTFMTQWSLLGPFELKIFYDSMTAKTNKPVGYIIKTGTCDLWTLKANVRPYWQENQNQNPNTPSM